MKDPKNLTDSYIAGHIENSGHIRLWSKVPRT